MLLLFKKRLFLAKSILRVCLYPWEFSSIMMEEQFCNDNIREAE